MKNTEAIEKAKSARNWAHRVAAKRFESPQSPCYLCYQGDYPCGAITWYSCMTGQELYLLLEKHGLNPYWEFKN